MNSSKKYIYLIVALGLIIMVVIPTILDMYNSKKHNSILESSTELVYGKLSEPEQKKELDTQIKIIIAGILKYTGEIEEVYKEDNVNKILNEFVIKDGVYFSNRAEEKMLGILKENADIQYILDKDGYLLKNNKNTNDISKQLNSLIEGDRCIIIDYNPYYYSKLGNDICTFKIEETDYIEKFECDNITILIFNPIKCEEEYESSKDIINQIIINSR